ncbi:MAG TPA: UDP-N-acetylglucosamine 2-epimerase (non-hydrolyzing) [Terriglobales bacterium]|nr:UDP-N-acetylglucosamine 2-epimerase (non-hydrolyzing) [Terriglobales bacterium]
MTRESPFNVFNIVGARPNMMKMAPIIAEMRHYPDLKPTLVHTGQHYDYAMSQVFLEQLEMGRPDFNLEVGSGTHHQQTAEIIRKFGQLVEQESPDLIVVAGDVNSTMACTLVGAKEMVPVAHVESGLRSFDRRMPEEVNRIVTDSLAELLFTTEESANENLRREGVPAEKIFFTGNVMIDSLVRALEAARHSPILDQLGLRRRHYGVLTLHRPSNVDNPEKFSETLCAVATIAAEIPIIFPVHPRTAVRARDLKIPNMFAWTRNAPVAENGIWTLDPVSYIEFLCLMDGASIVITDSGGIQEETTYLGVPCLTYRDNTERPVTVSAGSNRLVGTNPSDLIREARSVLGSPRSPRQVPPLWDGHAAERIVEVIRNYLSRRREPD